MPGKTVVRRYAAGLAALLLIAACGSDDPAATAEGGGAFEITEVVFGSHVTLTNNSADAVEIEGMWLCNRPAYVPLRGTLAAGESVTIEAGDLGGLAEDGGEVGLFVSRNFESADDIVGYVAWGTGGGREGVAVEAGLWTPGQEPPADGPRLSSADGATTTSTGGGGY